MSAFRSIWSVQTRLFHLTAPAAAKKSKEYTRLLNYVRKVDVTVQHNAGDEVTKGMKIPLVKPDTPMYKYEARYFKRQNRGLFGGLQRRSGFTCSEYFNKNKRAVLPNIVSKKLWSETLNKPLKLRVSTKVLKTITKEGGLDNYLTKDKPAREKTLGALGWKLRYKVLNRLEFNKLPRYGNTQVFYVHGDGRQFIVGRRKLVDQLFVLAQRDSYTPLNYERFARENMTLEWPELVEQLDAYGFDFTPVLYNTSGSPQVKTSESAPAVSI